MEIFSDTKGLRQYLRKAKCQKKSIGFVPTMGALHEGHLKLIHTSKKHNDITVCSIFVNPTQFNNPDDLKKYPRDTKTDLAKLEDVLCDMVFVPQVEIMYNEKSFLHFHFKSLEEIMEGKYRPGHFKGVGIVVAKLFNLIEPNKAYFGTKDLQQLTIIKRLTEELLYNIQIISVDTVREPNGLAMSSRNKLLSSEDKKHATDLYNTLLTAKQKLNNGDSVVSVQTYVQDFFKSESKIKLEYFEIVDTNNLQKVTKIHSAEDVSLCIAGHLGKVRLIDNISLN